MWCSNILSPIKITEDNGDNISLNNLIELKRDEKLDATKSLIKNILRQINSESVLDETNVNELNKDLLPDIDGNKLNFWRR